VQRKSQLTITLAAAALAILSATAIHAHDQSPDLAAYHPVYQASAPAKGKYSLTTSSGVAFADFKGYEDWSVVSSARTDEVLKVIVANPAMINAYKSGVPLNGQPFPEGSRIAKLQWKFKKSTEAPFVVDVPSEFRQVFFMEKDSKRFPKSGGWGYAVFNYEPASDKFTADPSPADCGNTCHTAVKVKDYIFHPYQKR
jgi:Cytochrome P460